jgi:hypothetical protein
MATQASFFFTNLTDAERVMCPSLPPDAVAHGASMRAMV